MELRNLGRSGLRVSAVGLGCNNLGGRIDLAASHRVVEAALEAGITLFDVADIYGRDSHYGASEEALGEILGSRRNDIVLATKFGMKMNDAGTLMGASRRYIMQAVEASLRRLCTDWIDLYQLHTPDPLTPIDETLRALDDVIQSGKVRYIGCSNLAPWQVVQAEHVGREIGSNRFVSCQDDFSLITDGLRCHLLPALEAYGLGLLPYFPLAGGLLTGKYRRNTAPPADSRFGRFARLGNPYLNDRNFDRVEQLEAVARGHGHSLVELAFGWLLAQGPVASVIAGATRPGQVQANVAAGSKRLDPATLAAIEAVLAR
ncbi:aldo/keto reductase [Lichenicoccus sp.]|uniref:aldo/keto reductase n=1 Tax=Lichenicoccus sp. TaxID=2781899 RepID=UPI003D12B685